jgi:hypothetical protein
MDLPLWAVHFNLAFRVISPNLQGPTNKGCDIYFLPNHHVVVFDAQTISDGTGRS